MSQDIVGYKVEASKVRASSLKSETSIDISAFLAMGDIDHGEKFLKNVLHVIVLKQDGGNKIGPKLWNVMFRPVGAVTDYKYSKALSSYKKEWTWEEMNGFLIKPSNGLQGNKMGICWT